eukprot:6960010-Prorocentrum_lima.AAC.1
MDVFDLSAHWWRTPAEARRAAASATEELTTIVNTEAVPDIKMALEDAAKSRGGKTEKKAARCEATDGAGNILHTITAAALTKWTEEVEAITTAEQASVLRRVATRLGVELGL